MTPANIALAQFLQRQRRPVPDHEARLRPWAAIALHAGSDPRALAPDVQAAVEDYRRANLSESVARACVAADLCPKADALAELARARDAALDAVPDPADEGFAKASARAHALQVLAAYLGAPPYQPARRAPAQQEAA